MLEQNEIDIGTIQYNGFAKDDWSIELENYGIRFELIGDDPLYPKPRR